MNKKNLPPESRSKFAHAQLTTGHLEFQLLFPGCRASRHSVTYNLLDISVSYFIRISSYMDRLALNQKNTKLGDLREKVQDSVVAKGFLVQPVKTGTVNNLGRVSCSVFFINEL